MDPRPRVVEWCWQQHVEATQDLGCGDRDMSGCFLFLSQSHKAVARLTGLALRRKLQHAMLQKSEDLRFEIWL